MRSLLWCLAAICLPAHAQPVLIQSDTPGALDVASVRTYAGVVPARTTPVQPSGEIVVAVFAGTSATAVQPALASLGRAVPPGRVQLAIVSKEGKRTVGPFATRAQFDAAAKQVAEALAGETAPPPAIDSLPVMFSEHAGAWRTVILAGDLPAPPADRTAWLASRVAQAFREQRTRVAHWSPSGESPDLLRRLARLTSGAVAADLAEVAAFVDRSPQAYAEIEWTPPPLLAGFHEYTAVLLRRDGSTWIDVPAIVSVAGFALPDAAAWANARAAVASAGKLLAAQSLSAADAAQVREALQQALSVNPADAEALRLAADFYRRGQDHKTAAGMLERLIPLAAEDAALWSELGAAHFNAGNLAEAERCTRRAWELNAEDPDIAGQLGRIRAATGNEAAAAPLLEAALKAKPNQPGLLLLRADIAAKQPDRAKAIEWLERAAAAADIGLDRRTKLIGLLLEAGVPDRARTHLDAALPQLPADAATRATYAAFLERFGRNPEALALWRSVLESDPRSERAHAALARLLLQLGDPHGALAAAEAGLQHSPESPALHLAAAEAYASRGELYKHAAALRRAAAKADDPAVLERLAVFEDRYGRDAAAAYAALVNALEKTAPASDRHAAALLRGHEVALRDEDWGRAEWFASRLRALGRMPAAVLAPRERERSQVRVLGGLAALAFIAHSKSAASPERFFVEYANAAVRQTTEGQSAVAESYVAGLRDYFRRVSELARLGTASAEGVTITLSAANKQAASDCARVLDLLGWRLDVSRDRVRLEPGGNLPQSRRQETLSALAVDEVGMKEALEARQPFRLEIPIDRAGILLGEDQWRSAFYPGEGLPGGFAEAIARDVRIARLYIGLSQLDEKTVAALVTGVGLKKLAEDFAELLFRYAPALATGPRGIVVPGGQAAEGVWSKLAGAPPADPARFVRALLDRDGGRLLAYFFTLSQLDGARQRFFTNSAARTARFYELLKDAPEFQRGAEAMVRNASFLEFLREVPLDADGKVTFPGSPEVWMVAKGSSGSAGHAAGLVRKLSRVAAPDVEDDILIRLARTRYEAERTHKSELDNFLAVVRIDRRRSVPLDEASALLLAQHHAGFGSAYPYFAVQTGLGRAEFEQFFAFGRAARDLDPVTLNAVLGQWHSLAALQCLLAEAGTLDEARAAALFREMCARFASAKTRAAFTGAALESMRALIEAAAPDGRDPDERIRTALVGKMPPVEFDFRGAPRRLDPSAARQTDFERVLEIQKVTRLEPLFKLFDGANAAAAGKLGPEAIARIIESERQKLLVVRLPEGMPSERKAKENLESFRPAEIDKIAVRFRSLARKKKIDPKNVARLAADLLEELHPQVCTALTGLIYARYTSAADLLVSEDPLLVRKHQFFELDRKDEGIFTDSDLVVLTSGGGTFASGGFADFNVAAGRIAARSARANPVTELAVASLFSAVRSSDFRRLREEDARLLALTIRAGREWIAAAASHSELRAGLAEAVHGLLPTVRQRALLDAVDARDWASAWRAITLSDTFFLGRRLWGEAGASHPVYALAPSPVLQELRLLSKSNTGARLHALGPAPVLLSGCAYPRLLPLPPYEEFERYLFPAAVGERSAELKLHLAAALGSLGIPPEAIAALAEPVTREIARGLEMTGPRDWSSLLAAYSRIDEKMILALLDQP